MLLQRAALPFADNSFSTMERIRRRESLSWLESMRLTLIGLRHARGHIKLRQPLEFAFLAIPSHFTSPLLRFSSSQSSLGGSSSSEQEEDASSQGSTR